MSPAISVTFCDRLVNHFQSIVKESNDRLSEAKSCTDPTDQKVKECFSKGIWYAQDYYRELERIGFGQPDWFQNFRKMNGGGFPVAITGGMFVPTGYKNEFAVTPSSSPSVALAGFKNQSSLHFLDCGLIYSLAFSHALHDHLGSDRFNLLFSSNKAFPYRLSPNTPTNWEDIFVKVSEIKDKAGLKKGDRRFFSNVSDYSKKHPFGEAIGYNVAYAGEGRFLGFGLPTQGTTKEGVEQALFNAYNECPVDRSSVSFHAEPVQWEEFQKLPTASQNSIDGKLCKHVISPNYQFIDDMARLSLGELKGFVSSWGS